MYHKYVITKINCRWKRAWWVKSCTRSRKILIEKVTKKHFAFLCKELSKSEHWFSKQTNYFYARSTKSCIRSRFSNILKYFAFLCEEPSTCFSFWHTLETFFCVKFKCPRQHFNLIKSWKCNVIGLMEQKFFQYVPHGKVLRKRRRVKATELVWSSLKAVNVLTLLVKIRAGACKKGKSASKAPWWYHSVSVCFSLKQDNV